MYEISCGAVLFSGNENRHYVLVKSAANNHWGLPKGHIENNETEQETALREIMEETGVKAEIIQGFREQIEYTMPNGIQKKVVFFIAKYDENQELQNNLSEINNIMIGTIDEALNILSHDDVKNVLINADKWITDYINSTLI